MHVPLDVVLRIASVMDVLSSLRRSVLLVAFGAVVFAPLLIRFEHVHQVYGGGDAASQEPKTNCPSCGARIPTADDACGYCEESLTDDTSDYGWIDD